MISIFQVLFCFTNRTDVATRYGKDTVRVTTKFGNFHKVLIYEALFLYCFFFTKTDLDFVCVIN